MTDLSLQDQINKFIAERGVTLCPPALAKGSEANSATARHVAAERRQWRAQRASEAAQQAAGA